jgi:hypothetical protein
MSCTSSPFHSKKGVDSMGVNARLINGRTLRNSWLEFVASRELEYARSAERRAVLPELVRVGQTHNSAGIAIDVSLAVRIEAYRIRDIENLGAEL